jgi:hypothetical protein
VEIGLLLVNYLSKFLVSSFNSVGLVLGTNVEMWRQSLPDGRLKLSELLAMYYSEDGVFEPKYRACQRRDLYSEVASNTVMEEQVQKYFHLSPSTQLSWDSSVSTVSDYRLDNWGSITGRGKGFFL